jgi:hypothetical protein
MATYYAINAGGNFSAGGTWSTTATKDASRTGGATAPTNADTCILDDYSGAVTVDHATACLCKILDCTSNGNYASTLTFTAAKVLFVSGNVIFSAAMTIAGTGTLTINAACALTPGVTFTGSVSLAGTTVTLGADWTITGSLTSASGTNVMNGNTCYIGGSLTATVALSGTTLLVMNGTGTISSATTAIAVSNNMTVNTLGTITVGSYFVYSTGTFKWLAGNISGVGTFFSRACTLDTASVTFPLIMFSQNGNITLESDFHATNVTFPTLTLAFLGVYNHYYANVSYYSNGGAAAPNITYPSGVTVTITNYIGGNNLRTSQFGLDATTNTIKSSTPSSAFYLNFQGPPQNCLLYGLCFADVNASGSAQEIKNYNGGTLTRCTNIRNVNLPVIPSSVSIGG